MKKIANLFLIILIIGGFIIYNKTNNKSHYTITPDTNVSKVRGLSKYVTQEEVDDFSFRYWDIDSNYTKDIPPNLIPLRTYLKQKDTNRVLEYIKDNNLSIDIKIQDNTTPLMYSSFYNDLNTSNKLINLGANIRAKDKYGLSPLAYAIENNSTKTVKLLLDRGVRFEELGKIQSYLYSLWYTAGFKQLTIDENNNTKIYYEYKLGEKNTGSKGGVTWFGYIIGQNMYEVLDLALKSGYRPSFKKPEWLVTGFREEHNISVHYALLTSMPTYKPLLELLLKYNVYGKPTKEELKRAYEYCYEDFISETKRYKERMKKIDYNTLDKRGRVGKIIWKSRIENYGKYCKEKNSTFTIREYFAWANEDEKKDKMLSFIDVSKNIDKVFYTQSNSTKEINSTNKK